MTMTKFSAASCRLSGGPSLRMSLAVSELSTPLVALQLAAGQAVQDR